MTVTIERAADAEYILYGSDGSEITTYNQSEMAHPDSWIDDARDAGESINGPYDWGYIDSRDISY